MRTLWGGCIVSLSVVGLLIAALEGPAPRAAAEDSVTESTLVPKVTAAKKTDEKPADAKLKKEITAKGPPVLVAFCTDYCPYCKKMEPVIAQLKKKFAGSAKVVRIDRDKHRDLAHDYDVKAVPTFLVMDDGRVVGRHVGTTSQAKLAGMLEKRLDKK